VTGRIQLGRKGNGRGLRVMCIGIRKGMQDSIVGVNLARVVRKEMWDVVEEEKSRLAWGC
jgi:hypothetical protein